MLMRERAKAEGYRLFDPGPRVLCKRGHNALRRVDTGACVECMRLADKARTLRRATDPQLNRARCRRRRELYAQNPERKRAEWREYWAKNAAWLREYKRKQYRKNAARGINAQMAWIKANPEKVRVIQNTRRARKQNAGGQFSGRDIKQLFRLQKARCVACDKKLGKSYHIDHIIPLARGGSNDRLNIQLLCGPCNLSKQARDPIDFMRDKGFLL